MVKVVRFFWLTLAFFVLAPVSAQEAAPPVLPDPPSPMPLPEGAASEQATAFADALDQNADNLAAWLGLYDAVGVPVIGADGLPVGSTPSDDPVGPQFWQVWYGAGLSRPGHGIPLADAGRLLALGLEDTPGDLAENAALGAALSDDLLAGLRLATRGSEPQARLLGYFVRERILRGVGGVDILEKDMTPDRAVIDLATFDLLRWAILRATLIESISTATAQSVVMPRVASPAALTFPALQGGQSPCSGMLGDEDVTYWVNWGINKVGGGFQLPGMKQAFAGVIDRVAEKLGVSQSAAGRISKAASWGNAVTSAISLAMQLAALDVGFAFDPDKLVRTKTTDAGHNMTIHVALSSNPEDTPDGNNRAACFASFVLNALGISFSFPAGGRISGAEVLFEGGEGFPDKVLFGNYQQLKQDTDANGEVQLDVIGRAQKKDLPDSVTPTDEEFSVKISAQPEAVNGNTIANIFFGGLTFGVAPSGGGAAGSVVDILKTFRYSLGEYFFPFQDWQLPGYSASGGAEGVTITGVICGLDKPFTLTGVVEGGSITLSYIPGDAKSGSYSYTGAAANSGALSGEGTYSIADRGDTLLLTESGTGCVMGGAFCASGVENITLTPLDSDECATD